MLETPASARTSTADSDQVAKGKALFLVGCSSCHGQNAEGIQTVRGNQLGPPLVGVGAAAVDFQVGTGRMPLAQPGDQALRKRPVFNDEEVAALAAFVGSLGPGPSIPTKTDTSNLSNAEMVQGGEFFRTNCTACHNFAGKGGALPKGKAGAAADRCLVQAPHRGHADRPAADAGLLQRRALAEGQARDRRLPEEERVLPRLRRVFWFICPGLRVELSGDRTQRRLSE